VGFKYSLIAHLLWRESAFWERTAGGLATPKEKVVMARPKTTRESVGRRRAVTHSTVHPLSSPGWADHRERGHAQRDHRPDEEEASAGLGDFAADTLPRFGADGVAWYKDVPRPNANSNEEETE
jgi:hypothetical protein